MSAIRAKLLGRLTKANAAGKGVKITDGYSVTWKNEAKRLQTEGKVTFKGGRLFLTKQA